MILESRRMKNIIFTSLLFSLIFLSCSTEKNTSVNRFYHNTTAYYNGYFNARELIKEKNKVFFKTRKEDYSKILHINRYPDEKESKDWFPDMNSAIKKTSKVIAKHAMPRDKVGKYSRTEYGKWMDENWLVMGQSYFYKREYDTAIIRFKYVEKMYQKDPSKYSAKLWLARTYIEMENMGEANKYLQEIINEKDASARKEASQKKRKKRRSTYNKKKRGRNSKIKVIQDREKLKQSRSIIVPFPEELTDDLVATLADFHLRRGELEECIEYLDSAIKITKKKKEKIRYKFIKAQIHQEMGEKALAYENYSYVIKRNAPYEMIFYSKINRALIANSSDRKSLRKELLKLAGDEKYDEFKDQIYYALAELELQDKNKPKAIKYLQLSASYPSSNETQKGKTYIKLAYLYFEDKDYLGAQKYYDSSLTVLPNTYFDYENIKEKSESLTLLVGYINNVKLQDSLQAIANIKDEKKRLDRIEEILYQEKLLKEKLEKEKLKAAGETTTKIGSDPGSKAKFWMYNPQAKTFGYNEFKSTWGDVKLEDNWRRKNKNKSFAGNEEEGSGDAPTVSDKEIKAFSDKLPLSEELMGESNLSIINSLYLSGLIYRDKLNDNPEAIKSFNEVNKRFYPDTKIVPSLYQLYKTYMGESKRINDANQIKTIIIDEYPNTEEAKILKDPTYASRIKNAQEKNKNEYAAIYKLVKEGQNQTSIDRINAVLKSPEQNPYKCKLIYLKAKAFGAMQKMDSLEVSLTNVIKQCSGDPLAEIAQDALRKLKNIEKEKEKQKARDSIFSYEPNAEHFFLVIVPNGDYDMNTIKTSISNLNNTSFKPKNLKVNSTFLDIKTQTVLVKSFPDKKEARSYYYAYQLDKKYVKEFSSKFDYYIISAKNFSQLFISKDIEKFKEFYGKYYVD